MHCCTTPRSVRFFTLSPIQAGKAGWCLYGIVNEWDKVEEPVGVFSRLDKVLDMTNGGNVHVIGF